MFTPQDGGAPASTAAPATTAAASPAPSPLTGVYIRPYGVTCTSGSITNGATGCSLSADPVVVTAGVPFVPTVQHTYSDGGFYPICGHNAWNWEDHAPNTVNTISHNFCRAIGFSDGTIQHNSKNGTRGF